MSRHLKRRSRRNYGRRSSTRGFCARTRRRREEGRTMVVPRRIDSHVHFWQLARGDYRWLTPALAPIYRDFGPDELAPLIEAAGIDAVVLVQAAPSEAETHFLLDWATRYDRVAGVVGWVDMEARDAPGRIAALA